MPQQAAPEPLRPHSRHILDDVRRSRLEEWLRPSVTSVRLADYQGDDYKQDWAFSNYKDFDGLKRATKIETKRNGKKFIEQEISEFKVLDKVEPKAFAEP